MPFRRHWPWYCFHISGQYRVIHDDVIKWKHFPRYWPFVRGIHRSPVNSPHKGQWRGALMFSLICVWINSWVNNGEAGDLRRYRAHYDVTVMLQGLTCGMIVTGRGLKLCVHQEWHSIKHNVINTSSLRRNDPSPCKLYGNFIQAPDDALALHMTQNLAKRQNICINSFSGLLGW